MEFLAITPWMSTFPWWHRLYSKERSRSRRPRSSAKESFLIQKTKFSYSCSRASRRSLASLKTTTNICTGYWNTHQTRDRAVQLGDEIPRRHACYLLQMAMWSASVRSCLQILRVKDLLHRALLFIRKKTTWDGRRTLGG
jgi:hypothetical protein